jgi:Cys-tRNA(Pro)/Cys-tRNA(Cys) deacylase
MTEHFFEKTNAMRLLEKEGIPFETLGYEVDENDLSAVHAASLLSLDADQVFKTIVLSGERTGYFVCVIPGSCEINLKKAAAAAGDKGCGLLPMKELEPLTGYVRGGCSPLGMKKKLPTFIDETAFLFDRVSVSAGRRGLQLFIAPEDLIRASGAAPADLI